MGKRGISGRRFDQPGERGALFQRKLGRRFAEIHFGSLRDTVGIGAEIDGIQIHFKDFIF